MTRWTSLQREMSDTARRLVSIRQVHGTRVLVHLGGWEGWLRAGEEADGHIAAEKGIALTVGIADCVPVFIAHPSGVVALLHSGWRGTAARITDRSDCGARPPWSAPRRACDPSGTRDLRKVLRGEYRGPRAADRRARNQTRQGRSEITHRRACDRDGRAENHRQLILHALRQRPVLLTQSRRRGSSDRSHGGSSLSAQLGSRVASPYAAGRLDSSQPPFYIV